MNLPVESGRLVLKEQASHHSDLANTLKSGLTKNTIRFYDHVPTHQLQRSLIVRDLVSLRTRIARLKQVNGKKLILENSKLVKVFRKIIDRQSGKPLFKAAKIKITGITDHTYITDKGKIYRGYTLSLSQRFKKLLTLKVVENLSKNAINYQR